MLTISDYYYRWSWYKLVIVFPEKCPQLHPVRPLHPTHTVNFQFFLLLWPWNQFFVISSLLCPSYIHRWKNGKDPTTGSQGIVQTRKCQSSVMQKKKKKKKKKKISSLLSVLCYVQVIYRWKFGKEPTTGSQGILQTRKCHLLSSVCCYVQEPTISSQDIVQTRKCHSRVMLTPTPVGGEHDNARYMVWSVSQSGGWSFSQYASHSVQ